MSMAVKFPALRDTGSFGRFVDDGATRSRETVKSGGEQVAAEAPAVESDPVFTAEQIRQFRQDDAVAVGNIAKILTTLFTYTVLIMSVVIFWTFAVVS